MNIAAPLDKKEEVEVLAEAGVKEFYCGVMPSSWTKKYNTASSMNRREWHQSNFPSFEDLKQAKQKADSLGIPVHLTMNAANISDKQLGLMMEQFDTAIKSGVEIFIISDVGLLMHVLKQNLGIKFHISCGTVAINSEALNFFKRFGASRVILPRHLTVQEIVDLKKKSSGIELEPFIMNEACKNVDGYCEFLHGLTDQYDREVMACTIHYSVKVLSRQKNPSKERTVSRRASEMFTKYKAGCGLCALHDFYHAGIDSLKIVGRGMPTQKKVQDIKLVADKIQRLREGISRQAFVRECKEEFRERHHKSCGSYDCYYP